MRGWKAHFKQYAPTGSRIICTPAPTGTDEDWIALDSSGSGAEWLQQNGYTEDGNPEFYTGNDNGSFRSFRLGDLNVITTPSKEFFDLFVSATSLAKRLNLTEKADRIALFQIALYGVRAVDLEVSQ